MKAGGLVALIYVISATNVSAQTADQFDLDCQGTEVRSHNKDGERFASEPVPVNYRIQVDMASEQFCIGECSYTEPVRVRGSTFIVMPEMADPHYSYFTVELDTGAFRHVEILASGYDPETDITSHDGGTTIREGQCTRAPFSGLLPAQNTTEREMLEQFRMLELKDQRAVLVILNSLASDRDDDEANE